MEKKDQILESIAELGYIEVGVTSLDDWQQYADNVLGVSSEAQEGVLNLSYDSTIWRIQAKPTGEDDITCLGFCLTSEEALQSVCQRLSAQGINISDGSEEECAARQVEQLKICFDPDGLRVELYIGERLGTLAFKSPIGVGGFVTEGQGLGHVVLCASDLEAAKQFYLDGLGFLLSDHIVVGPPDQQLELTFLHCNPRHHTLALVPIPLPKRLNHIMLQVADMDDVGYGLDRAKTAGVRISSGLGKHPNDEMFSFYMATPSGFDIEYGWGGLEIDDSVWQPKTFNQTSIWGHQPESTK